MNTQPEPENRRSPNFSVCIETTLLINEIKKMKHADIITYSFCNNLIGQDVQKGARHILSSARRICQREYQIVTDAVQNIGIRRLTDVEVTNSGIRIFSSIQRAAKRGVDRITSVDWDTLPDEEKIRHNAGISALQLIRVMARPKSIDRITSAVNTEATGQLPIARTLDLFRGPKKV
jgi:hypothetical protein